MSILNCRVLVGTSALEKQLSTDDDSVWAVAAEQAASHLYRALFSTNDGTSHRSDECLADFGTVRYIGPLEGDPQGGVWCGIEWDLPSRGKNDGTFQNRQYFSPCGSFWLLSSKVRERTSSSSEFDLVRCSFIKMSRLEHDIASLRQGSEGKFKYAHFGESMYSAIKQRYINKVSIEKMREDLVVVDARTNRKKPVQFVGLEDAENFFRELSALQHISLTRGLVVSSGDIQQLGMLAVRSFQLAEQYLLQDWSVIWDILIALPSLEVLQIQGNLGLSLSQTQLENISSELTFPGLRELDVSVLPLSWDNLVKLCARFPGLQQLHVSSAAMTTLPTKMHPLSGGFNQLKELRLDNNNLGSAFPTGGGSVDIVTSLLSSVLCSLPKLLILSLNRCSLFCKSSTLGLVDIASVPMHLESLSKKSVDMRIRLERLDLENNCLTLWLQLSLVALSFPSLKSIRVQYNPFCSSSAEYCCGKTHTSDALAFGLPTHVVVNQICIALLPDLENVNGEVITASSRIDAERYVLTLIFHKHNVLQHIIDIENVRCRLIQRHGDGLLKRDIGQTVDALNSIDRRLISVRFEPDVAISKDGFPITKSVLYSTTINDLKQMCRRLYNLPTDAKMSLMIEYAKGLGMHEMDDGDADLMSYGVSLDEKATTRIAIVLPIEPDKGFGTRGQGMRKTNIVRPT